LHGGILAGTPPPSPSTRIPKDLHNSTPGIPTSTPLFLIPS
jgi:hypothetical protein